MSPSESVKRRLARLGRGRYLMRRLPQDLGHCYIPASLEGGAKFLRRDLSRADVPLTTFARDFVEPGMTVWDIGANVGLFTFAAAGLAGTSGTVLAVEPDTWLVENLRRGARANRARGSVAVLPAAISDKVGVAEFHIARSTRATNYLAAAGGSTMTGGVRERQVVATLTLDSLLTFSPPPDVVKIDVEGAELGTIRGGLQALAHAPPLLIEVYSENAFEADQLLRVCGYRKYIDAESGGVVASPSDNCIALR